MIFSTKKAREENPLPLGIDFPNGLIEVIRHTPN
jgi:hypothetical protein